MFKHKNVVYQKYKFSNFVFVKTMPSKKKLKIMAKISIVLNFSIYGGFVHIIVEITAIAMP